MALSVICFLDNDIILKLSAFDLLDMAIAVLKLTSVRDKECDKKGANPIG